MSSARLIRPARLRRAGVVSAGALALCLSAAGTSYADTLPPPLPSPDSVITTLDQTVTSVTGTDPGLAPAPTSGSPTGTAPAPTTQTTKTTPTQSTKRAPATTVTRHATRPSAAVAAPANPSGAVAWAAPANAAALSLPPATTVASQTGSSPAVAPLLMPQVTQRITPAAAMVEADKHSGSPVRGIMLTLAIAAALALGYEHGRLARQGAVG